MRGHATSIVIDEAIDFVERAAGSPFLLFVTFHAPHEPISTPSRITSLYPGETTANRAAYFGSVSMVDAEIGRLLRTLDARLLRENTVVFFTSDNGPETLNRYKGSERSYGSPGALRGMKLHLTEAGFRVPGIIRWPKVVQPGRVSADPVSGLDLLPTFCELAGVPVAKDVRLDGVSLVPLLRGNELKRPHPLYWEYPEAISKPWKLALRDGPWKLLSTPDFSRFELFNLAVDPSEAVSLAASESERLAAMSLRLRQLNAEVNGRVAPLK
jgi:arylsulfatase A